MAEYYPSNHPRVLPDGMSLTRRLYATIEQPVNVFYLDITIHIDVWIAATLELGLYDTSIHGMVDPIDHSSKHAQLNLAESTQPLSDDVRRFRVGESGIYINSLQHICEQMEWKQSDFRCYRCRVPHAPYGSQISMSFDL